MSLSNDDAKYSDRDDSDVWGLGTAGATCDGWTSSLAKVAVAAGAALGTYMYNIQVSICIGFLGNKKN